jgi:hypothetical protein
MQANVDGNTEGLCYGKWRDCLRRPIHSPHCAQIDVTRRGAHDFSSTSIPQYPIFILSLAFSLVPFFWIYLHLTAEWWTAEWWTAESLSFFVPFCICPRLLSERDLFALLLVCFLTECLLAKLVNKKK